MSTHPQGRGDQRTHDHAENSANYCARVISNSNAAGGASNLDRQRGSESASNHSENKTDDQSNKNAVETFCNRAQPGSDQCAEACANHRT